MIEHYADLPDERQKIEDWCRDIDPCDDTHLYERLKTTGIIENSHKLKFHIYLRRRWPNNPRLEHVKKWDNALPGIEEIGSTFGAGTAVRIGITNDPNDWSKEVGNSRYILDLLLSIINVSMKTIKIVEGLPQVKFE